MPEKKTTIKAEVSPEFKEDFKHAASLHEESQSTAARKAIRNYIDDKKERYPNKWPKP